MTSDATKTQAFVAERWEQTILPTLREYIRIPNKSPAFDAEWQAYGHMDAAVELLDAWVESQEVAGLRHEIVRLPNRTPVLFCEIPASNGREDGPTVLLYGHYDKQPEFDGWDDGLRPGNRSIGTASSMAAAAPTTAMRCSLADRHRRARPAQDIAHARCVLLIEGCEESGSFDLPFYVEQLRDASARPTWWSAWTPSAATTTAVDHHVAARHAPGYACSSRSSARVSTRGAAGGIVPSTFRILRQVLERVEDAASGELHAALQVNIPEQVIAAARRRRAGARCHGLRALPLDRGRTSRRE